MLEKCRESPALRKAFPIISVIYTTEERGQADVIPVPESSGEIEAVVDTKSTIDKIKQEVTK